MNRQLPNVLGFFVKGEEETRDEKFGGKILVNRIYILWLKKK